MSCLEKIKIGWKLIRNYWNTLIICGIPLLFLPLALTSDKAYHCTYILFIVAIFWITEVLNLAVTSLIPIVLFPAFGLLTPSEVASCYMKDITIMLIGGLIVAKAIEEQNLHTRLALKILIFMGPNPIFQYLGFMLASWFLSMWISNTATTAMMITLGSAVIEQWEIMADSDYHKENNNSQETLDIEINPIEQGVSQMELVENNYSKDNSVKNELQKIEKFSKGLYLCIAYSATCGGIATLTGTAPNLVFYGFMEERYGSKFGLNFGTFMLFALPVSAISLLITWLIMCLRYVGLKEMFKRTKDKAKDEKKTNIITNQYKDLGPMSYGEISALSIFCILVLLWILREPGVPLLGRLFTYTNSSGTPVKYWSDATSATLVSLLAFMLPSKNPFKKENRSKQIPRLLNWKVLEKEFPWGLVFLFGGGFTLAAGCSKSGLSDIIGNFLTHLSNLPEFLIILFVALGISFLTEVTSNTATSTILIPIMLQMAECIRMHPMKIALATGIASSFSFCLPAATPPNAIIFSTGRLRVIDMASSGLALNFLCVFVLTIMCNFYSIPIFNTSTFPSWIITNCTKS